MTKVQYQLIAIQQTAEKSGQFIAPNISRRSGHSQDWEVSTRVLNLLEDSVFPKS